MADESKVNPQVVDTVELTNRVVDEAARQATTAIAFQEITQSMAMAVQSGVDHLQSTFSLNVATTGAVFARAIEDGESLEELNAALNASQATVSAAITDLAKLVGEAARAMQELSLPGEETGKNHAE
jgi:ABC-type protease/lipase transport system fused ATPase/permease subunit